VKGDVSKTAEAEAIIDAALKAYARLDILVNNAGVYEAASLEEISEQHFHRLFDINVLGLLNMTKAATRHLHEGASIINISSLASRITSPGYAVYSATKGAVDAITGVLAKELGPRRIRVNAVNPGVVETEGTHRAGLVGSDFERDAVAQTPLGRVGQPQDIATVVAFLASDDAGWITGERLFASGGL
jgi:3-oxoacyl-[acyl-carrier protein] reductase